MNIKLELEQEILKMLPRKRYRKVCDIALTPKQNSLINKTYDSALSASLTALSKKVVGVEEIAKFILHNPKLGEFGLAEALQSKFVILKREGE